MSNPTTSPRFKYNADLCEKFMAKHKIYSRYPAVLDQAEHLPLDLSKLVRFGYNPSIVNGQLGMVMAYRYHDGDTLNTKLALAEVDLKGEVMSNRTLELPDPQGEVLSYDDPRLFWWQDKLMVSWCEGTWPRRPVTAVVKYGEIQGNKVVSIHQPAVPNPKPIEKNWVPLPYGEKLFFIYECEPEQRIFEVADARIVDELNTPSLSWPYGPPRGGIMSKPYNGQLLRFFHSSLDNEFPPQIRRYFVGACLMESKPPFRMLAISKRPILYGSEVDYLTSDQRRKCVQYKRQVVFPGGAGFNSTSFLLSVGINDSACAILKIKPDQLNLA